MPFYLTFLWILCCPQIKFELQNVIFRQFKKSGNSQHLYVHDILWISSQIYLVTFLFCSNEIRCYILAQACKQFIHVGYRRTVTSAFRDIINLLIFTVTVFGLLSYLPSQVCKTTHYLSNVVMPRNSWCQVVTCFTCPLTQMPFVSLSLGQRFPAEMLKLFPVSTLSSIYM